MNGHKWVHKNKYHMYGHMRKNQLSDTKGICIPPKGNDLCIGYFKANGGVDRPCFTCNDHELVVYD